ncbi:MAG: zf-HC2 domain-containing protein [Bryobacterales bacterium]|nr:zf-HC2 domain-containing protein [Bryobacterales bacterium]
MTKLECKEIFEKLSEYLDRQLPADMCDQIDEHIGACPPCVQFVESLRKTMELCKDLQEEEKPAPLPGHAISDLRLAYQKFSRERNAEKGVLKNGREA